MSGTGNASWNCVRDRFFCSMGKILAIATNQFCFLRDQSLSGKYTLGNDTQRIRSIALVWSNFVFFFFGCSFAVILVLFAAVALRCILFAVYLFVVVFLSHFFFFLFLVSYRSFSSSWASGQSSNALCRNSKQFQSRIQESRR